MFGALVRWLVRLLFFGLIAGVIAFIVTRVLGGEDEDFEDFEELESSFEFNETPVEIDVSASDTGDSLADSTSAMTAAAEAYSEVYEGETGLAEIGSSGPSTDALGELETSEGTPRSFDTGPVARHEDGASGPRLIDIKGIGPGYEGRLHTIGITSMEDLLNADPASIAEQLGVIGGQAQVEDWVEQARAMLRDHEG